MKNYSQILRKCPLFDGIKEQDITAMLSCLDAKVKRYTKKESVISDGDDASYVRIVLSGKVQLERTDYYGNRSIVTSAGETELFGESFACAESKTFPFDAIAYEDSEIMMIDSKKILYSCSNACEFHNRMIFNLMRIIATKNIVLNQKAEITAKRTTREKLMTYLLATAKKNASDSFVIPYDRQELADYLEVDRSGLSAEISKLRSEGILESKKSWFKILNHTS